MAQGIRNDQRAFTLIELLTTIAIIGLLATLALISLKVAKEKAMISNAQHDIDQIWKAFVLMQNDTGQWPGHQAINIACASAPGGCQANNEICGPDQTGADCLNGLGDSYAGLLANHVPAYPNWHGPYMKASIIEDPWGREYFFDTDYSVDVNERPCACSGVDCHNVAVIGSYGPDELARPDGAGAYGCDDIIYIIGR
jgi:prepilin-type N-terminal cleavage/methylation domain-containing protein